MAAQEVGKDWPSIPLSPRREPGTGRAENGGKKGDYSCIIDVRDTASQPIHFVCLKFIFKALICSHLAKKNQRVEKEIFS